MLLATLLLSVLAGDESPSSSLATPTPAERAIGFARASIAADEKAFQHHNALAWALARRARETADPDFYDEAERAVARSLELAPDNFEAKKAAVW